MNFTEKTRIDKDTILVSMAVANFYKLVHKKERWMLFVIWKVAPL